MTAVQDPKVGHRVRGLFDAYHPYVEPEPVVEVTTLLDSVEPALTPAADVVDQASSPLVDYASIATVGQLPVVNEEHGVAWYVGQRGLSYFPLITGAPLSVHSFDWRSVVVQTPEFPTVRVSAVVLAGCGTPCVPIPEHEQLPADIPLAYCPDPRCWAQPEPTPGTGADQQTEN